MKAVSFINMQDGIIKSSLVQQVQQRVDEITRLQQASHVNFNEELARQADEVVLEAKQTENNESDEADEQDEPSGNERPGLGRIDITI
jgi:hypothetical protein